MTELTSSLATAIDRGEGTCWANLHAMRLYGDPEGVNLQGVVLTVCGIRPEGELSVGGTCFLIAPQIAVAAKHVVQDIHERFELGELRQGRNDVGFGIRVAGHGSAAGIDFGVEALSFCPRSDMALLFLLAQNQPTFDYQHRLELEGVPHLNFTPPGVGSRIWTFGYTNQRAQGELFGQLQWEAERKVSSGIVREYFPERRDAGLITFPSFQTNAEFLGHMSGGPVANPAGEIVGVVSIGLNDGEPEAGAEPVSYVASLWPLLETRVFVTRRERPEGEELYLFDLYRDGFMNGLNWNHPEYDRRSDQFLARVPRPLPVNE